jgi:hypothetical protein
VKQKQFDEIFFVVNFQPVLAPDECKQAAYFEQEEMSNSRLR